MFKNEYADGKQRETGKGGAFRPLVARKPRTGLSLSDSGDVGWEAVCAAVDVGIGVLLSSTSDGGAISLTLYAGDERYRTYCGNPEELADAFRAIQVQVDKTISSAQASASRNRS